MQQHSLIMTITLCNICTISVQQKYEPPLPLILNGMVIKEVSRVQRSELHSLLQYTSIV